MTGGALAAAQLLPRRRRWEQLNFRVVLMLDWDDVQAVATRAVTTSPDVRDVAQLLSRFREQGATHLSLPELTLNRLLSKGQVSVTQGHSTSRVYIQTQSAALAALVATELKARLPHLDVKRSRGNIISFSGDLPSVAEIGLGFDPDHAKLAHQAGLSPVARPIGYSWVQPEMIERTLGQAAKLGARIVAVQGDLIPGHEFKIQHTVEAMRRNRLVYAYFRESRHQKGDWFLAKHLAPAGLVMLAHEFAPQELLAEDLFTASYRWANLAVEAGIRLCSIRFFKILHAADPLESVDYVKELARALDQAGLSIGEPDGEGLVAAQPGPDQISLAWAGLSTAGAAGLAADLLPIADSLKLVTVAAGAATLAGLPLLGRNQQEHQHDHGHTHPGHHDRHLEPGHTHHHGHEHGSGHSHGPALATTYAQKGLALAATAVYPAAATAISGAEPLAALVQGAAVGAAGATTVAATTVAADYLLGIEEYRGYNFDWLIPLGLAASTNLLASSNPQSIIKNQKSTRLLLAGIALAAFRSLAGHLAPDLPATFDREHRHAHTHHLSEFQAKLGDLKMALSPRPLRKWALLAPLGMVSAALFKRNNQDELAAIALTASAAGHVATLTGFRHGQRPLEKTIEGRARGWAVGLALAGAVWLVISLINKIRNS